MTTRAIAAALLAAALLPVACGSAATPARVYQFGRHGGNIAPWTATIGAGGKIQVSGVARRTRTVVPATGMAALAARFAAIRFFALPKTIRCGRRLPDVATLWVSARRRGVTHTVDAQLGCSARFDAAFATLKRVSRVQG